MQLELNDETYNQWKGLIKKIAYKYSSNSMKLEFDDLVQIGSIGFIDGIRSYKESMGVPLMNYLAKCISNEILKELKSQRCNKRKVNWKSVSLSSPVSNDEDGQVLEDIITDELGNVAQDIEDKLMADFLKTIFYKHLDTDTAFIFTKYLIENNTFESISSILDKSPEDIRKEFNKGKDVLFKQSNYFRTLKEKRKEKIKKKSISITDIDTYLYSNSAESAALKFALWDV